MSRKLPIPTAAACVLVLLAGCGDTPTPTSLEVIRAAKSGPNGGGQTTRVTVFLTGAFLTPPEGQPADLLSEEPLLDVDGADTDAEKGADDWADDTRIALNLEHTKSALGEPGGLEACAFSTNDPTRQQELRADLLRYLVHPEQGRGWSTDIDVAALDLPSHQNVLRNGWFDGSRGPLHLHVGSDALFPGSTTCESPSVDEWRCSGGTVAFRDRSGKPKDHARIVCPADPADVWTVRVVRVDA